jgi:small subunit ribosomal protein S18
MEEKQETKEIKKETSEVKQTSTTTERRPYKPRTGGSGGKRPFRGNRSSKNFFFKKKVCFFCKNKKAEADYKDVGLMKRFISESFKISPRRFTGTCAKHQRRLIKEIKKARQMALIPYLDK